MRWEENLSFFEWFNWDATGETISPEAAELWSFHRCFFQGGIFCIVYIFICLPKVGFNDIPWLTWLFLPDFFYGLANSIWKIRNGYGSLPKNHSSMGWWSPQSRLETTGQIYVSWFNMDISMVLCREIFTGTIDFPIFSMGVSCKMSQQINWDMDIFTHFVKHDDSLPYIYIVI
jgi:hypothetical protein